MTGYLLGTLVCTDLGSLTSGAAWPPHLREGGGSGLTLGSGKGVAEASSCAEYTPPPPAGGLGIWAHPGKGVAEASSCAEYTPCGRVGDLGSLLRERGG